MPGSSEVVGALSEFTEAQIVSTLANADVVFTCKRCGACQDTLPEFVRHTVACLPTSDPDASRDPAPIRPSVPWARDVGAASLVPKVESLAEGLEVMTPDVATVALPSVRRHTTRCSTGTIRRRNVAELFAKYSESPDEDTPEAAGKRKRRPAEDSPRAKRGRPRKEVVVVKEEVREEEEAVVEVKTEPSSDDGAGDETLVVVSVLTGEREELVVTATVADVMLAPTMDDDVTAADGGGGEGEEMRDFPEGIYAVNLDGERLNISIPPLEDDDDDDDEDEDGSDYLPPPPSSPAPKTTVTAAAKKKTHQRKASAAQQRRKPQHAAWKRSHKYKCARCKMRYFSTQFEHELHAGCHAPAADAYACVQCAYACTGWNRMLLHVIGHEDIRQRLADTTSVRNIVGQFDCPVCAKSFEKKSNMKGHYRKVRHRPADQSE